MTLYIQCHKPALNYILNAFIFNFWGSGFTFPPCMFAILIWHCTKAMALQWGDQLHQELRKSLAAQRMYWIHSTTQTSQRKQMRKDKDLPDQDISSHSSQHSIFHFLLYKLEDCPHFYNKHSEVAVCQIRLSHCCLWHFNKWVFSVMY